MEFEIRMDITEENIEELVQKTSEPDMLKELVQFALKFEREDLIEAILDKVIQQNHLIDKLKNQ